MKRTSIALAVMSATLASVKSWSVATLSTSLYARFSYPMSGRKTGIATSRRAAKKRRRARNG
ncbi:TPA: hypothetical protein ACG0EZ_002413 [Enterobacter ludwigii]